MMITKINFTNFKAKLTPLSEYKGPVLKLTEEEVKRVKFLTDKKEVLEKKLDLIKKELAQSIKIINGNKVNLLESKEYIESQLLSINNAIHGIKKNRLKIQKEEAISKNI